MKHWIGITALAIASAISTAQTTNPSGLEQRNLIQHQFGDRPQVNLSGSIVETHTVRLRDLNSPHLVATVQGKDGSRTSVDLGSANAIEKSTHAGDPVRVVGEFGHIDRKPVLFANQISIGDKSFNIDRPDEPDAAAVKGSGANLANTSQPIPALISGTVLDIKSGRLNGMDADHRFIKLQANSGETIVVDLGSENEMERKLDLHQGQLLTLSGKFGQVNGKKVLFADQVAEVIRIQRSSTNPNAQRASFLSGASTAPGQSR